MGKHRLVLFLLFVSTASIVANVSQWSSRPTLTGLLESWRTGHPYLSLGRALIAQKDMVINVRPLRDQIRSEVAKWPAGSITVYVEFLNTGSNIIVNPDLYIYPASLIKTPIVMTATKKIERGEWRRTNELVLMQGDRDPGWGTLYNERIGTTFTIERLITEVLVHSDNTAYNILYRNLSGSELDAMVDELGLEQLFDTNGKLSAREYSRILRSLFTASYLNEEYSQWLLALLDTTPYAEYLESGLPEGTVFSHKFGENDDTQVIGDAGIVYLTNRPYLITVMIDRKKAGMSLDQAKTFLRSLSSMTYAYFSTTK